MEYTVLELARLAGVTGRTLRYYDEIGLLHPAYVNASGYRIYQEAQVDALQQILFFRELGLDLRGIKAAMEDPSFERLDALEAHRKHLLGEQARLADLLQTVEKTIQNIKGEIAMSNEEKFQGMKEQRIQDNERAYGQEVRARYGHEAADASNAKLRGMSQQAYQAMEALGADILRRLAKAVEADASPSGEEGKAIYAMHREWLETSWPQYSAEAHKGLADTYVSDERFAAYYDQHAKGAAAFLRDAIHAWAE